MVVVHINYITVIWEFQPTWESYNPPYTEGESDACIARLVKIQESIQNKFLKFFDIQSYFSATSIFYVNQKVWAQSVEVWYLEILKNI